MIRAVSPGRGERIAHISLRTCSSASVLKSGPHTSHCLSHSGDEGGVLSPAMRACGISYCCPHAHAWGYRLPPATRARPGRKTNAGARPRIRPLRGACPKKAGGPAFRPPGPFMRPVLRSSQVEIYDTTVSFSPIVVQPTTTIMAQPLPPDFSSTATAGTNVCKQGNRNIFFGNYFALWCLLGQTFSV